MSDIYLHHTRRKTSPTHDRSGHPIGPIAIVLHKRIITLLFTITAVAIGLALLAIDPTIIPIVMTRNRYPRSSGMERPDLN